MLLATFVFLIPACIIGPFFKRGAFAILKIWGRFALFIFSITVEVEDRNNGSYNNPPYIFINLNQTSLTETFIMAAYTPANFITISNIEYAIIPLVGWIQIALGGIIIIKQNKTKAKKSIERAQEVLKIKKNNMMISIEGKRTEDGELQPYKKGPIVLALANHTPIVPYITIGAYECMPYGSWKIKPGKINLIYDKIVDTNSYNIDDRNKLLSLLRTIAEKELNLKQEVIKNDSRILIHTF